MSVSGDSKEAKLNSDGNHLRPISHGGKPSGGTGISVNVHLTVPPQAAGQQDGSGNHTPNTPEILNSIVSMQTGPFEGYSERTTNLCPTTTHAQQHTANQEPSANLHPTSSLFLEQDYNTSNVIPVISECDSDNKQHSLTVQQYASQFIKEGLKMKVRQKLVERSNGDVIEPSHATMEIASNIPCYSPPVNIIGPATSSTLVNIHQMKHEQLTPEDEERRRRRRERNKVAATKCRNKKKLHTQLLIKESGTLMSLNQSLKQEIAKLEIEKDRIVGVLSKHKDSFCRMQDCTFFSSLTLETSVTLAPPITITNTRPTLSGATDPSTSVKPISHLKILPSDICLQDYQSATCERAQLLSGNLAEIPSSMSQMQLESKPSFVDSLKSSQNKLQTEMEEYFCSIQKTELSRQIEREPDHTEVNSFQAIPAEKNYVTDRAQQGNCLGKTSLSNTYLDLDSRCIAL